MKCGIRPIFIFLVTFCVFLPFTTFSQTDIITTYAGPQLPVEGVSARSQPVDGPYGVAVSTSGDLYVVSSRQNRVYRISPDGVLHRYVSAQLFTPSGIALDKAGNVYVAEPSKNRIRKITPDGITTTVAGNRVYGYSGDNGPATEARLATPTGVAVDSTGNLYIADKYNYRIRKVTADGIIRTIAGNGTLGSRGDGGPATAGGLATPVSVALDSAGNLYIGESDRVRKVTPEGTISTVADLPAVTYYGVTPDGVAADSKGNVYVADSRNSRVLKIAAAGQVSLFAGNRDGVNPGDGGPATEAYLSGPFGIAADPAGNVYFTEIYDNRSRVRMVNSEGIIHTVAGDATAGFEGDGDFRTEARFNNPMGLALDSTGNLYASDTWNHRVRRIAADGTVTTIAGIGTPGFSGDRGRAEDAQLSYPMGLALDSAGNLYIADQGNSRIRKIKPDGIISTVAGRDRYLQFSGDGGLATEADLNNPSAVAIDQSGNLYIADTRNNRVRKVTPEGIISTMAGNGMGGFNGGEGGPATNCPVANPMSLALDKGGNLYIATDQFIRRVSPDGIIRIVAGGFQNNLPDDNTPADKVRLGFTVGVVLDSFGNMVLADGHNIFRITPDGIIRTIAVAYTEGFDGDGGPAISAQIDFSGDWGAHEPVGIAADSAGKLYFTDTGNHRIREISPSPSALTLTIGQGGAAATSTIGLPPPRLSSGGNSRSPMLLGYTDVDTMSGVNPYGTAVLSFTQNEVVVSEIGVPASPPTKASRIFVDYRLGAPAVPGRMDSGSVDVQTGIALVNPGNVVANVTYTLRRTDGTVLATGHGTIAAASHYSKFLSQLNDVAPDFSLPSDFATAIQFGALDITSDQSISVLALRETDNQRLEAIFTTTPVTDLTASANNSHSFFPQIVNGAGYTTTLILMNTSGTPETGSLKFWDDSGNPLSVTIVGDGGGATIGYSLPPNGVSRVQTDGSPATARRGWAEIVPDYGTTTPIGSGLFGYNPGRVLISETGIPSSNATTHARIYVDLSQAHDSGLAIANTASAAATIALKAFRIDGITPAGSNQASMNLSAGGHTSGFVREWFDGLPSQFTGVLDISSTAPFSALTLRSLINDRNEFLMTTFPVADSTRFAPAPIVFPQILDGGGYRSQLILMPAGGQANSTIKFIGEKGNPLTIGMP
jgi:sugar lactone lactonase YvrE